MTYTEISHTDVTTVPANANLETKFDDTGTPNPDGSFTIFDLEKKLIEKINIFYAKYAEYVRCNRDIPTQDNYGVNTYHNATTNINIRTRCTTNITSDQVDSAFGDVKTSADALRTASTSIGSTGGTDNEEFTRKYNEILDKYSNNLKLRGELDLKLKEIFKTDDSKFNESKLQYDSAMYTGIVWTILATSCLYYVFTSL